MRLVLTGAGGGHFYPLVAVAEKVFTDAPQAGIPEVEIYFLSDQAYDPDLLKEKNIKFVKVPAGKLRLYFSWQNFLAPFKSFWGFFVALYKLFKIYPDTVFVKGGYASLPIVFAAKILFIPIFVHESDSVPGKTNLVAGKLAKRVATSYPETTKYFNHKKVAYTGQPILQEYLPTGKDLDNKLATYKNSSERKTIFILGGSQGSQNINSIVLLCLSELLKKYNVIHQVGANNLETIKLSTKILLEKDPNKQYYRFFAFEDLKKDYLASDLAVTRAGSSLFELSAWGIPSVVIPIASSNGNHQLLNATTFQDKGCSEIIEESNLRRNLFINVIESIVDNQAKYEAMRSANLQSFKKGAAETIAQEIVKIALSHA